MEQATETHVSANFDNKVDIVDVTFSFRKTKDQATGIETKRPSVELKVPYPSIEGIAEIYNAGDKQLALLRECVNDVINSRIRYLLSEDENLSQENFPFDKVTWEAIANLPKSERKGAAIAKELWEEFSKDYISVMPSLNGKSVEQCTNHTIIYMKKFAQCKTDKKILNVLSTQLDLYTASAPNAESFGELLMFLKDKIKTYMAAETEALLSNL